MNVRESIFAAIFFLLLLSTGCGRLYRVTPLPKEPVRTIISAPVNGLEVAATALDGDRSLEQFEANLPMAGVLAVEVVIANRAKMPISLESVQYTLVDPGGQTTTRLAPELALRRVMKFYGNRIYQIDAHRDTLADYHKIALLERGVVESGRETRGVLFFAISRQAPLLSGFSLAVRVDGQTVSLPLDKTP